MTDRIKTTYRSLYARYWPYWLFGQPTKHDLVVLRKRVAQTCGVSVEDVTEAIQ